jgi:hypothetical protein
MSQTTDSIDAVVNALWQGVAAQQDSYFAAHGVYYQLMWTHKQPPSSPSAPDNLSQRPTDQPAASFQGLPPTMRSRMKIDNYGKPDGWIMTLETVIDGVTWTKCIDCGTDVSRNQGWKDKP